MISCEGGRCAVEGPLTLENITAVLAEGERLFTAGQVTVDLGAVTEVDSSAVSLLLQWLRSAQKEGRSIAFVNLPPNLKSLAVLYGVADLIPGAA